MKARSLLARMIFRQPPQCNRIGVLTAFFVRGVRVRTQPAAKLLGTVWVQCFSQETELLDVTGYGTFASPLLAPVILPAASAAFRFTTQDTEKIMIFCPPLFARSSAGSLEQ
jgi:hypothetical protein